MSGNEIRDINSLISKLMELLIRGSEGAHRGEHVALEVSSEEEFNNILRRSKFVVICFYRPECPACKLYIPVFEAVSSKFKDVATFVKVRTKDLKTLAEKFNITAIPTTVVISNGKEVSRYEGSMSDMKLITFLIASGIKPK